MRGKRSKSPGISARGLVNSITNRRGSVSSLPPETVWTSNSDYAWDTRLLFKRRITALYVTTSSLKSYVELNYSGFRKVLKKYVHYFLLPVMTA
jgi:phosphate transporter